MTEVYSDEEYLRKQGRCCIIYCTEEPKEIDDMGNVFCPECAEQNRNEQPEEWGGYNSDEDFDEEWDEDLEDHSINCT